MVNPRAIVHLDLDAFFCSVEILKNPALKGKPVVVGRKTEERGVVAAASYQARKFGIHSAMSMHRAQKLCRDLVILPPRFKLYKTYSRIIMGILRNESNLIEQVSVDEAYLDLTSQINNWRNVIDIAKKLQLRIFRDIGLSASLGIATNKMIAKIASDFDKPAGFTVVKPGEEKSFLAPLSVQKIPGIGPKTAERLAEINIHTIAELSNLSAEKLHNLFGKLGSEMVSWAVGVDNRPVINERETKSISQERTFRHDLTKEEELLEVLHHLSIRVAEQLQNERLMTQTVSIKLRYTDFTTLTRQHSFADLTGSSEDIYNIAALLFKKTWKSNRPVRLLGVGCSKLSETVGQLALQL